jgi:hypothetical protein
MSMDRYESLYVDVLGRRWFSGSLVRWFVDDVDDDGGAILIPI